LRRQTISGSATGIRHEFSKEKPPNGAVPSEGSLPNERLFGAYFTPNGTATMTVIACGMLD